MTAAVARTETSYKPTSSAAARASRAEHISSVGWLKSMFVGWAPAMQFDSLNMCIAGAWIIIFARSGTRLGQQIM